MYRCGRCTTCVYKPLYNGVFNATNVIMHISQCYSLTVWMLNTFCTDVAFVWSYRKVNLLISIFRYMKYILIPCPCPVIGFGKSKPGFQIVFSMNYARQQSSSTTAVTWQLIKHVRLAFLWIGAVATCTENWKFGHPVLQIFSWTDAQTHPQIQACSSQCFLAK